MSVRIVSPADGSESMSFSWGDGTEILSKRQLIAVDPGSDLEQAIGVTNLADLTAQQLADASNGGAGAVTN
jgi:hypothetical protein